MKEKSKTAPIHLPTDSKELKGQICQLQEKNYRVIRLNQYQIKISKFNWYPNTGKITIDPCFKYKFRGFKAFLELIEASLPTKQRWSPQEPAPVVFKFSTFTETL